MNVTTSWAVSMARVSRVKFNEAVADGYYPCAPATEEGIAREFEDLDLVVLSIFGRLIELGIPGRRAANLACEAKAILDAHPNAESIYIVTTTSHAQQILIRPRTKEKYLLSLELNISAIGVALTEAYLKLLAAEQS
jgi:hypothetical protein